MKQYDGSGCEPVTAARHYEYKNENDLNWHKHIDATAKKVNKTRAFLQRNIKAIKGVPREDQGALYLDPGTANPGICQCHLGPIH